jgi:hypothetical protein
MLCPVFSVAITILSDFPRVSSLSNHSMVTRQKVVIPVMHE